MIKNMLKKYTNFPRKEQYGKTKRFLAIKSITWSRICWKYLKTSWKKHKEWKELHQQTLWIGKLPYICLSLPLNWNKLSGCSLQEKMLHEKAKEKHHWEDTFSKIIFTSITILLCQMFYLLCPVLHNDIELNTMFLCLIILD